MVETNYLNGLKNSESFTRQELFQSFIEGGFSLSESSFCKKIELLIKEGRIIRVGRNMYSIPQGDKMIYEHNYSLLAKEVASLIEQEYPTLKFTIFELTQLNDLVNHQIAHNIIFLSVEGALMEFIFETLKDKYPGKVLINPSSKIFHQYWTDNMIVIRKLTTESPLNSTERWHMRLEKLLVDVVSDQLILESIGESEYSNIYEESFKRYVLDEKCILRYAKRRNVEGKLKKLIFKSIN